MLLAKYAAREFQFFNETCGVVRKSDDATSIGKKKTRSRWHGYPSPTSSTSGQQQEGQRKCDQDWTKMAIF
jgi:hypothetical protein